MHVGQGHVKGRILISIMFIRDRRSYPWSRTGALVGLIVISPRLWVISTYMWFSICLCLCALLWCLWMIYDGYGYCMITCLCEDYDSSMNNCIYVDLYANVILNAIWIMGMNYGHELWTWIMDKNESMYEPRMFVHCIWLIRAANCLY